MKGSEVIISWCWWRTGATKKSKTANFVKKKRKRGSRKIITKKVKYDRLCLTDILIHGACNFDIKTTANEAKRKRHWQRQRIYYLNDLNDKLKIQSCGRISYVIPFHYVNEVVGFKAIFHCARVLRAAETRYSLFTNILLNFIRSGRKRCGCGATHPLIDDDNTCQI